VPGGRAAGWLVCEVGKSWHRGYFGGRRQRSGLNYRTDVLIMSGPYGPDLPAEGCGEDLPALVGRAARPPIAPRLREGLSEAKDGEARGGAGAALGERAEARFTAAESGEWRKLEAAPGDKDSGGTLSGAVVGTARIYKKKARGGVFFFSSLSGRCVAGGRAEAGAKQGPGAQSRTLRQVADPDEVGVASGRHAGGAAAETGREAAARDVGAAKDAAGVRRSSRPRRPGDRYQVQARGLRAVRPRSAPGSAAGGITAGAQYGPEGPRQGPKNWAGAQHIPSAGPPQLRGGNMTGRGSRAGWGMAGVYGNTRRRASWEQFHGQWARGLLGA